MKRILYITITIIIFIVQVNANEQPKSQQVIPPSPDAAALGKYGAYPVSFYTGIPQISISLYDLDAGELKLPISLSYHASGIRVDDIATSTGLGWSLNAGGCISVEVKGTPDIIPANRYNEENLNIPYPRIKSINFDEYFGNYFLNIFPLDILLKLSNKTLDCEPDIYNLNVGGINAQFFMDENFQPIFLKNNDGIKITYYPNDTVFSVIDKQGSKYIFGHKDITLSDSYQYGLQTDKFLPASGSVSTNKSYTSWRLSKIISPNQTDIVNFTHDLTTEEYTTRIYGEIQSYELKNLEVNRQDFKNVVLLNHWELLPTNASFNNSHIINISNRLREINYNNSLVTLTFHYSDRMDIKGAKQLDKMNIIYNNSGELLSWIFNYSYFQTDYITYESVNNGKGNINELNKKLKLVSVQRWYNNNTKAENKYQFEYYNENNTTLPYRNSNNGFDHWGYYNAATTSIDAKSAIKSFPAINITNTNGNLMINQIGIAPILGGTYPIYNITELPLTTSYPLLDIGGNRMPTLEFTKSYSLKSIHYPTGGKSVFDYENNTYTAVGNNSQTGVCGGLRIKKITDIADANTSVIREYEYEGGVVFSKINYLSNFYCPDTRAAFGGAFNFKNYSDISNSSYGDVIGYKSVTENVIDSNKIVKSKYEYYTANEYPPGYYQKAGIVFSIPHKQSTKLLHNQNTYEKLLRPFDAMILGKSYKRGMLRKTTKYNADKVILEEEFTYDIIPGLKVFANRVINGDNPRSNASPTNYSQYYYFDIYFHETGKYFINSKTEKLYDKYGSNPVTKITTYEYDTNTELLKSSTDSIGNKTIRSETKYPSNYTNFPYYQGSPHPFQQMQMRNMINYPVEQKTYVNSKLTNATITTYMSDNPSTNTGKILHNATYGLNTNVPLTDFAALTSGDGNTAYNINTPMSQEMTYTYYPDGNIREVKSNKTGVTTAYLWSYKGQYPVAEIKNATFSEILTTLQGITPEQLSNSVVPDMSKVEALRLNSGLLKAQISTYTYKPLIGIATMTDPRGVTTWYDYDDFNRLKQTYIIENGEKKILQKFDYHYANQQ